MPRTYAIGPAARPRSFGKCRFHDVGRKRYEVPDRTSGLGNSEGKTLERARMIRIILGNDEEIVDRRQENAVEGQCGYPIRSFARDRQAQSAGRQQKLPSGSRLAISQGMRRLAGLLTVIYLLIDYDPCGDATRFVRHYPKSVTFQGCRSPIKDTNSAFPTSACSRCESALSVPIALCSAFRFPK